MGESSKFALILPAGAVLQLLVAPVAEGAAAGESRKAQVVMLGVEGSGRAQAGGSAGTGPISDSERLAAVVQATGVGLWEWDMVVQQVHFSTEWKRQLGYADDEIGDDFDEWVRRLHPEDRERVMQAGADYLAGREAFTGRPSGCGTRTGRTGTSSHKGRYTMMRPVSRHACLGRIQTSRRR